MTIPVYLFTGFLESGKTTVLKETLLDPDFHTGERSLILICEDGIESYDDAFLKKTNSTLITILRESDMSAAFFETCDRFIEPERVCIEFNGIWSLHAFLALKFPEHWLFVQTISMVDASTFEGYLKNMRSLIYEQLYFSDSIIFNRCDEDTKKLYLRNNVKAINKSAQLIYETVAGEITELGVNDLPFDIQQDSITIEDDDYGVWYMEVLEHPTMYDGKTIHLNGKVIDNTIEGEPNIFVLGRYAMVCCGDDLALIALVCHYVHAKSLHPGEWVRVFAQMKVEYDEEYQRNIMLLHVIEIETIEPLKNELVNFT